MAILLFSCTSPKRQAYIKDPVTRTTLAKLEDYRECVRRSETFQSYRKLQTSWRMIAQFTINPDGTVKDPQITNSDFEEKPLHHCVVKEISTLVFPGQADPVQVRQLLDLTPVEVQ